MNLTPKWKPSKTVGWKGIASLLGITLIYHIIISPDIPVQRQLVYWSLLPRYWFFTLFRSPWKTCHKTLQSLPRTCWDASFTPYFSKWPALGNAMPQDMKRRHSIQWSDSWGVGHHVSVWTSHEWHTAETLCTWWYLRRRDGRKVRERRRRWNSK